MTYNVFGGTLSLTLSLSHEDKFHSQNPLLQVTFSGTIKSTQTFELRSIE